MKKTIQY